MKLLDFNRIGLNRRLVLAGLLAASFSVFLPRFLSKVVHAAEVAPTLKIEGAVTTPLALTADDLGKMPRTTASLTHDGTSTTYEGVSLYDILVKAGVPFGRDMTGKPMASYLLATSRDGYQVVFSLAELDPKFGGEKVIIADKADGAPLPNREQPFRIVVPQDKMGARCMYSLIKLEVVRLRQ